MLKILAAIDGSKSCEKSAQKAEELALLCGSDLTFLTIIEPKLEFIRDEEEFKESRKNIELEKEKSNKMLQECNEIYNECQLVGQDCDVKVDRVVMEGVHPADKICNYAEQNGYDLIVISDKGRTNIKKFLLGSVTEKVVRHSKVSVLVVK